MRNFVQPGDTLDMVAPSGGVVSGAGVLIGAVFGVPVVSAAQGETFALQVTGVFDLTAATGAGTDFAAGVKLYWDNTAKVVTKVATDNTFIGHALAAKATGGAVARVRLVPGGA